MKHLKGIRFGFSAIKRVGVIDDKETHRITWNVHAGCELHYVLKGSFDWEIAGQTASLNVPGGTFAVVPPHTKHRAVGEAGTPSVRIGIICEPPSPKSAAGSAFSADDLKRVFAQFKSNALIVRTIPDPLLRLLKDVRGTTETFNPNDPNEQLRLRVLCEMLLVETARTFETEDVLTRDGDVIPHIRKWIGEHLAEDISTSDLVHRSGYGRSRFFELFLSETGMTPNDYLVRERVDRAKRLIREKPQCTLSSIARECGFKSGHVFSAVFRKHVGMPPTAFKR